MQIVINNQNLETRLMKKAQKLKMKVDDLIIELLSDSLQDDKLEYSKKDIRHHLRKLEVQDSDEPATNPFTDVEDTAAYSNVLRQNAER